MWSISFFVFQKLIMQQLKIVMSQNNYFLCKWNFSKEYHKSFFDLNFLHLLLRHCSLHFWLQRHFQLLWVKAINQIVFPFCWGLKNRLFLSIFQNSRQKNIFLVWLKKLIYDFYSLEKIKLSFWQESNEIRGPFCISIFLRKGLKFFWDLIIIIVVLSEQNIL